jgi:hypothetical protein
VVEHLVFQRLSTANNASSSHYSWDREGVKGAKYPDVKYCVKDAIRHKGQRTKDGLAAHPLG